MTKRNDTKLETLEHAAIDQVAGGWGHHFGGFGGYGGFYRPALYANYANPYYYYGYNPYVAAAYWYAMQNR